MQLTLKAFKDVIRVSNCHRPFKELYHICSFLMTAMPCLKLRTPGHGAISCDTWAYGRYCSMSCNDNYDIPAPSPFQPATDVFTCGSSGQWNPTSYVPDCSRKFRIGYQQIHEGRRSFVSFRCSDTGRLILIKKMSEIISRCLRKCI